MIGHDKQAGQHTQQNLPEVTELLRDLPRVNVPPDFNASLMARLAVAKNEMKDTTGVAELLKDLPRVTAPPDFNFQLRARIARAAEAEQKQSLGWLTEFWKQSFSLAQSAVALAIVAVVISAVAYQFRTTETPVRSSDIATNTVPLQTFNEPTPPPSDNEPILSQSAAVNESPANVDAVASRNYSIRNVRSVKTRTITAAASPIASPADSGTRSTPVAVDSSMIAARTVVIKHRSGGARVITLSEYNLGLQAASIRTTSNTSSSNNQETVLSANIF